MTLYKNKVSKRLRTSKNIMSSEDKSRKHCLIFWPKYSACEFKHSYILLKNHDLPRVKLLFFSFCLGCCFVDA